MKKKTFWATPRGSLIKDIATSTCLVGASAGIVFGASAGTFHISYANTNSAEARLLALASAGYGSENISSAWNMNEIKDGDNVVMPGIDAPTSQDITPEWWKSIHGQDAKMLKDVDNEMELETAEGSSISEEAIKRRHKYAAMVIDGATHSTMDRSFNQSLYEGIVDFIQNKKCSSYEAANIEDPIGHNSAKSYPPSADNTAEFINTYLSVIDKHDVIGLAGFNHSTPLTRLMVHPTDEDGNVTSGLAVCTNDDVTKLVSSKGFILLDSNIANNQNIASVQFRADQPGFLAAISTCQYFLNNLNLYHNEYQDLSVGLYGGVQIPTVTVYMGGFQRGIEFFNYTTIKNSILIGAKRWFDLPPSNEGEWPIETDVHLESFEKMLSHSKIKQQISSLTKDTNGYERFVAEYADQLYQEFSVKVIKLGDTSTHFSGSFTSGDAIGITKQYLNRGASAIIAVAGPQSLDTAQEIQNQNSKCIVVGVDAAMEESDYQRFHKNCNESNKERPNEDDPYMDKTVAPDGSISQQANAVIKFSAIKDIKTVSKKIVQLCAEGKNWDVSDSKDASKPDPEKAICSLGFQTCGNIQNGLISISWDGFYPLVQALKHVYFYFDGSDEPISFDDAWKNMAEEYFSEHADLDSDFVGTNAAEEGLGARWIKNLLTFTRYKIVGNEKIQTTYYKNYNHVMGILGKLLDKGHVQFTADMSLVKDEESGKLRAMTFEEQGTNGKKISVLEWLEWNMYLAY